MSSKNRLRTALLLLIASLAAHRPAAGQDLDAMTKWTEAKVVHYRIAGAFSGKMSILGGAHTIRHAEVTDHVEFELDWDNQEMKLLGTPVLRNSPTKLGVIDPPPPDLLGCPPARIETPPEFATVTRVTAMSVLLQIELTWRSAGGALPWVGETSGGKCGDLWDSSTPSEGELQIPLQLPPGMLLAMPAESIGYDVSKDGKSLLTKPENGWTWTITPSIVR